MEVSLPVRTGTDMPRTSTDINSPKKGKCLPEVRGGEPPKDFPIFSVVAFDYSKSVNANIRKQRRSSLFNNHSSNLVVYPQGDALALRATGKAKDF